MKDTKEIQSIVTRAATWNKLVAAAELGTLPVFEYYIDDKWKAPDFESFVSLGPVETLNRLFEDVVEDGRSYSAHPLRICNEPIGRKLVGHPELLPPYAWHRDDFRLYDIPVGYRPLILNEQIQEGDYVYNHNAAGRWTKISYTYGFSLTDGRRAEKSAVSTRTRRPIPAYCVRYVAEEPKTAPMVVQHVVRPCATVRERDGIVCCSVNTVFKDGIIVAFRTPDSCVNLLVSYNQLKIEGWEFLDSADKWRPCDDCYKQAMTK